MAKPKIPMKGDEEEGDGKFVPPWLVKKGKKKVTKKKVAKKTAKKC